MQSLGVISYLNMFPYFSIDLPMVFAETPSELIRLSVQGEVGCACISAIAGLKNNFKPLHPLVGIGASTQVKSVYLEPIFRNQNVDRNFWTTFNSRNDNLFIHNTPKILPSPKIALLVTGASEHSEWLIKIISFFKGFSVEVFYVSPELALEKHQTILDKFSNLSEFSGVGLLLIGDRALVRSIKYPAFNELERLDVAKLWFNCTGLPCIFALWFVTSNNCKPSHNLLNEKISDSINKFKLLSPKEKNVLLQSWLQKQPLEKRLITSEFASVYLAGIEHKLQGYEQSWKLMQELYRKTKEII